MTLFRPFFSITLLSIFIFTSSSAQKIGNAGGVSVRSTKILQYDEDRLFEEIVSIDEDGFEVLFKTEEGYEYVTYDSNLKQSNVRKESFPEKKKEEDFGEGHNSTVWFNERRFLLKGTVDKEKLRNVFTMTEISEDGEIIGEPIELARVEGEPFYGNPRNAAFVGETNADESKLLVKLKLPEKRNAEGKKYRVYKYFVYDEGMNLLWSKVVEFRDKGGRVVYHGMDVFENDGTVLAWGILDRGRKVERENRFGIKFFGIGKDEVREVTANIRQKIDTWNIFKRYVNGRMYIFDTYGVADGEGIRMISWNSKDDEAVVKHIAFGQKHLVKNQPEKEVKRIQKLVEKGKPTFVGKFSIQDVVVRPDNSFVILGQEGYVKVIKVSDYTKYNEYYMMDFHMLGISADGEVNWSQIIPLNQKTTAGDNSCNIKFVGDRVYAIFNDSFKNLEDWSPAQGVTQYKGKKEAVAVSSFSISETDSPMKRSLLWSTKELGGWLYRGSFYPAKNVNSAIVHINADKGKYRLLRLDFD